MNAETKTNKLVLEIVTLFPKYFDAALSESIIGRAKGSRLFEVRIIDLRGYGIGKHRIVDDAPFGGGGGMVLALEPLVNALSDLGYQANETLPANSRLILTSAAGKSFNQKKAVQLSLAGRITFICGHYLGVDERITELFDIEEISIGDYVLTGGELATAVMIDAIVRLIPGALGDFSSALADSHQEGLLGAPVYTRPESFLGKTVPSELLSGDHKRVAEFRRQRSVRKTAQNRPDILARPEIAADLNEEEKEMLKRTRLAGAYGKENIHN